MITLNQFVETEMARLIEFELSMDLASETEPREHFEWWNLMDEYFVDNPFEDANRDDQPTYHFPEDVYHD